MKKVNQIRGRTIFTKNNVYTIHVFKYINFNIQNEILILINNNDVIKCVFDHDCVPLIQ